MGPMQNNLEVDEQKERRCSARIHKIVKGAKPSGSGGIVMCETPNAFDSNSKQD